MTNNQNKQQAAYHALKPIERKIGGTTYIVRVHLRTDSGALLMDKVWRNIQKTN